ncbi:hypothetical protein V5K00_RS23380 [Enterobacter asburiae]
MKAQPDVHYFFKEWPIFGGRWEASLQAAQQGLTVWQKKEPPAYVTYHNAIYATGHNEVKLTAEDIPGGASKAGLVTPASGDHTASQEKNCNLTGANAGDYRDACKRSHTGYHYYLTVNRYRGKAPARYSESLPVEMTRHLAPETFSSLPP